MEDALLIISQYYDSTSDNILALLNTNFKLKNSLIDKDIKSDIMKKSEIILPYYGEVNCDNCKHLVYNHGLYTQCKEKCIKGDSCKKCKNNKYGTVFDRQKHSIGQYITPSGKKELDYNSFILKMNYNINDVRRIFEKLNINYPLTLKNECNKTNEKKRRGRPCKNVNNKSEILDENVSIEVERKIINGVEYLITSSLIVLDSNSYDIVGVLVDNEIILE
jgi:hypothetical protein